MQQMIPKTTTIGQHTYHINQNQGIINSSLKTPQAQKLRQLKYHCCVLLVNFHLDIPFFHEKTNAKVAR